MRAAFTTLVVIAAMSATPHALAGHRPLENLRSEAGRVLGAEDGTSPDGASWTFWCVTGSDETPYGSPREDQQLVGADRPGWFFGVVNTTGEQPRRILVEKEVPDPAGPRFLAGYVAVTGGPERKARPMVWPTSRLHRVPVPMPARVGGVVVVTWDPVVFEAVPEALVAYRLHHSLTGDEPWELVAETPLTRFHHGIPEGCAGHYALSLVIEGRVETVWSATSDRADATTFDTDGDGVADACDNCPEDFGPEQRDLDGDGVGNLCDPDMPLLAVVVEKTDADDPGEIEVRVVGSSPRSTFSFHAGELRDPFAYADDVAPSCGLSLDGESVEVSSWCPGDEASCYYLAGPGSSLPVDWGRDSLGKVRPQPGRPCR